MRQRSFGILGAVTWVIIILLTAFLTTKHEWFDDISADDKAIFWSNIIVGVGTLLLAFATVWQARESKKIIAYEDIRFQRGRMPVLRLDNIYMSPSSTKHLNGWRIQVRNIGDGAACDCHVTFRVRFDVDDAHNTVNRVGPQTALFEVKDLFIASYVPSQEDAAKQEEVQTEVLLELRQVTVTVDEASLKYKDVFGSTYSTRYDYKTYSIHDPLSFSWKAPGKLIPENNASSYVD